jgi:TM2 domain-containing membrane protein YozV
MKNKFKVFILLLFLLFQTRLDAQQLATININFLNHLKAEKLEIERLAYYHLVDLSSLTSNDFTKDLIYLAAKYYDSTLIKNYSIYAHDSISLTHTYYGALALNLNSIGDKVLAALIQQNRANTILQEMKELKLFIDGKSKELEESNHFYNTTHLINRLQKKSVLLATLFSTILPGAGKVYLLQNTEAIGALTMNVMTAAPLIESMLKIGLISTSSIIGALVFIPIYLANIYGTSQTKRVLLNKLKTQLNHEILDYCLYQLRN